MDVAHETPVIPRVLYTLAIASGLWFVLPKAWHAARSLRPDMNLHMGVDVTGAVVIGQWFEAATVASLFALSLLLESWSVGRARRAVEALLDLSLPTALLKEKTGSREVPVADVSVGSHIIVKSGERIPLDGHVIRGSSGVNQSTITGESMPVTKHADDDVYAGTINGDGTLEIKTSEAAGDTTLAHVIRLVGEARSRRSSSEQWGGLVCTLVHSCCDAAGGGGVHPSAAVVCPVLVSLVLPVAGAAGHRLSMCVGDFDACKHRRRTHRRSAPRSSDQRRDVRRDAGGPEGIGIRQDRHAHARPSGRADDRAAFGSRRTRTARTRRRPGIAQQPSDRTSDSGNRQPMWCSRRTSGQLSSASRQRSDRPN